jgi:exodeoxyribonuclease-3
MCAANLPVVIAGDYNVAPTALDIYSETSSWKNDALIQPAPRAAYARLVAQGWCDAVRTLHPDERIYTFWDYLRNAWGRDAGLRLDHLLLSPQLRPQLMAAGVDREWRGREHASDHAPAWIELGTQKPLPARTARKRRAKK